MCEQDQAWQQHLGMRDMYIILHLQQLIGHSCYSAMPPGYRVPHVELTIDKQWTLFASRKA